MINSDMRVGWTRISLTLNPGYACYGEALQDTWNIFEVEQR
jgi:hypothetical protein